MANLRDNEIDYDLKIKLETADYSRTLNIEHPSPEEQITGTAIKTAFQDLLAHGWLIDNNGNAFALATEGSRYVTYSPITIPTE